MAEPMSPAEVAWLEARAALGPCIEWTGTIKNDGYGQRSFRNKLVLAHRWTWELVYGPIPKGMLVLHKCDNPSCVNIEHLFLGTWGDNIRDAAAKGRLGRRQTWTRKYKAHFRERAKKPRAKLTQAQADEIRDRYAAGGITTRALGAEYGVNASTIQSIIKGRSWVS